MAFFKTLASSILLTFALAPAALAQATGICSGDRNLALCAEFVIPFATNSFALQTECGVTATSANMLIAQNIQINNGTWWVDKIAILHSKTDDYIS